MRNIVLIALFIVLPATAQTAEKPRNGEAMFVSGIESYESGDYAGAVLYLSPAKDKLPLIGDYALLYMARSYVQMGMSAKAVTAISELNRNYTESPLRKEAQSVEVVALLNQDDPGALALLEQYVKEHPDDTDMKFMLAGLLKSLGRIFEAKAFYRELYVSACPLDNDALAELEPSDIDSEDLIERAKNLYAAKKYAAAESEIRRALVNCPPSLKQEALKTLAETLFSQRKYEEAASLFVKVGESYNAARAYIRIGNDRKFNKFMRQLVKAGDPKGADLMVSYAGLLHRNGKKDRALKMLRDVRKKYPRKDNDALWSMGWIHYMDGDYKKALTVFKQLAGKYRSSQYAYWYARTTEKTGGKAEALYEKIKGEDYYGLLAGLRTGRIRKPIEKENGTPKQPDYMERINLLHTVGLSDEAAGELILKAKKSKDHEERLGIALKLVELDKYPKAISLVFSLPGAMQPHEVLYPDAFWPVVSRTAQNEDIDPFLLISLMREESRFDPEALSSAGAVGLMQLMPATARRTARAMSITYNGTEALHEVDLNIRLGSRYLRLLLERFDAVPAALAAYNAGEGRVEKWLSSNNYESSDEFIEDIPFNETRNYVKRIISTYYRYTVARNGGPYASMQKVLEFGI